MTGKRLGSVNGRLGSEGFGEGIQGVKVFEEVKETGRAPSLQEGRGVSGFCVLDKILNPVRVR
jgi:hypothetical protein